MSSKTSWLIGASEGLGRALAEALVARGERVLISARASERLDTLARDLGAEAVPLDVTDRDAVQAAAEQVKAQGPIQRCVYLAGAYTPLSHTQWDARAIDTMLDVNLRGAFYAAEAALPLLKPGGQLVFVGSLAGLRGLPRSIGYGASKAGMMHLAQNLRAELNPEETRVQLINPGFIETRLTAKNRFAMPFLMRPEQAAEACVRAMESRRFRTDFPFWFGLSFRLMGLLPGRAYFALIRRLTRDEG